MASSTLTPLSGSSDNIYLQGNYAPVADEVTAADLQVIGELPRELNGRYLRNGPNPIGNIDEPTHHWFMGDGMVHGICLRDGKALWYRNRYVNSSRIAEARGASKPAGRNWNDSSLGPNTNVGGFAGTTWAMVEAGGCPVELTYELETVGYNDFNGTLPGAFLFLPSHFVLLLERRQLSSTFLTVPLRREVERPALLALERADGLRRPRRG